MQIFGENTLEKLGFQQILHKLAGRTQTEEGKHLAEILLPFTDPVELKEELARTHECLSLISFEEDYYFDFPGSVRSLIREAEVPGAWLAPDEFLALLRWLRMVRTLMTFFKNKAEKSPTLWKRVRMHEFRPEILREIERCIDDSGEVRDGASQKLGQIRKEKIAVSSDLRRLLHRILRQAQANGLSPDGEVTVRNDRLVIPLVSDFKGRVPGFVHDVSASGHTLFLEPSESLELNNRVRALSAAEQNEIRRILIELTGKISTHCPQLLGLLDLVGYLDLVRAKAKLAQDTHSVLPHFNPKGSDYLLVKARHPLLSLKNGNSTGKVVPLTLELSSDSRIILISGPNAGGKSVALKTTGLLQIMLQSGLLVPCDESSEFRWFDKILIDIGDEQSIQTDLSTYTSHLRNMGVMLQELGPNALFLIDEFGGGTDPKLGGAMAEAFLERFIQSEARGVITTHYGNLKSFADLHRGIQNAAMQFDPQNLSPTFHIQVGIPGRSYAFEIARKTGIPEALISDAQNRLAHEEVYSEDLLLKLEAQRHELDQVLGENKKKAEELKALLERNQHLGAELKERKSSILKEARDQAQNLIQQANAKIERTIREIREAQAEKEATKKLRHELASMLPELPPEEEKEIQESAFQPVTVEGETLGLGDWAKLKQASTFGKIIDLQGNRAILSAGDVRLTVKLKELIKIQAPDLTSGHSRTSAMLVHKKAHVTHELNVMGLRVEACLPVVAKFMDDAILSGLKEVRILHGKGGGALRQAIREFLRTYPEVIRMEDGHADHGGPGWTVVTLK